MDTNLNAIFIKIADDLQQAQVVANDINKTLEILTAKIQVLEDSKENDKQFYQELQKLLNERMNKV